MVFCSASRQIPPAGEMREEKEKVCCGKNMAAKWKEGRKTAIY
jgi:hypothetical protein